MRFYSKPLAALITAKGREALMTTITVVQQELYIVHICRRVCMYIYIYIYAYIYIYIYTCFVQQELQLDVVYGDTDSVFVNTKTQVYYNIL